MQAFYGGYAFDPNSLIPRTQKRTVFGPNGRPASVDNRIECTGKIFGNGQDDIVAKCAVLERALSIPFQNFGVKTDTGGIAILLPNATALGGVRVTEGPEYPEGDGVEFATVRTFRFVVEASYPQQVNLVLVVYDETVTFRGGGPQIVFLEPVNGPPIKQIAKEARPFYATQSGSATSLLTYATPARPLWPAALMETTVTRTTPEVTNGRRTNYKITWQYEFGSVGRLTGGPTII